ncbi:18056_t:CDS:2 [Rhizophagus irregularis]|nr:18056_t:CDS:2 [Rhizophagus irregularis]
MCPGLTSKGARLEEALPANTIVGVFAEGKEHALAIGLTKMSTDDIQSSLSISRNKHWKYISSYHGPWLQLPLELLESLYVINNENVSTPPLIDPIIFGNLISIRRLVDEAADLSVRAAAGISTTGGGPTRSSMSHTRQHRMRELAVNKLALAYRIDEIATAVVTMQSASAIDEVASKVLKKNPTNLDALYVNFFHEKIPSSRMLSQSTSTDVLDQIISTSPTIPEFYRTRGVVKCFKEEFTGALRDFKMALAHVKHRKRVNNVLLGKKSTLPLHNHHGNDDDECTGTESQLYFLRAACYLQYAISLIDKAIQKVDGVERKEGEGSELRLVAVKKGTASNHGSYSKLEEYRKELLPIMNQVQNLAKRSVRNYTHFLSFYPNSLPPFSPMNDETASKGSTPVTSRDSSPARSFKEKEDNGCCSSSSSNGHNDHQPNTKFFERTRKFTEKVTGVSSDNGNTWYAIAINYVLIGDIHTGAMWHSRTSEMHECIDGYPVFLPARSMAQADYMEVLERIKKSITSNSSYSNNSNGSSGPRQYPLHTQRADSVMMWLKAIILRQKENDGKASVAANTNGEVKPMMNGTSTKIIDNI